MLLKNIGGNNLIQYITTIEFSKLSAVLRNLSMTVKLQRKKRFALKIGIDGHLHLTNKTVL